MMSSLTGASTRRKKSYPKYSRFSRETLGLEIVRLQLCARFLPIRRCVSFRKAMNHFWLGSIFMLRASTRVTV